MRKTGSLVALVAGAATVVLSSPVGHAQIPNLRGSACRHDDDEIRQDRVRREQALTLARAINTAQGELARRTRRYGPLPQLTNLPQVPDGFTVRLFSNGEGYV